MRITKRSVDATRPTAKEAFYWDDEVRRFGMRVKPSGVKSYLIQYRNAQGHSRKVTIGQHGSWTPDEARAKAKELLRAVDDGKDPAERVQEERKALTVEQLCREYLAKCEAGLILGRGGRAKKASTLTTDRGRIERHIIPLLGRKLAKNVKSDDIVQFIEDVTTGATAADVKTGLRGRAIVEGGAGTARRTAGLLGGIFSYAQTKSRQTGVTTNPCRGVKRGRDNQRDFRLEADEYSGLGRALAEAETRGELWQACVAVRLLAFTGCRKSEIIKLRWPEVDFNSRCFRFGDPKSRAMVLHPVGEPAMNLLRELKVRSKGEYVLPAIRGQGHFGGLERAWGRIVGDAYSPHGLRHAYGSVAGDLGYSELTIGALLGHKIKVRSVTAGYVKLDAVVIAAADKVARSIHHAMTGESGVVVRLPVDASA